MLGGLFLFLAVICVAMEGLAYPTGLPCCSIREMPRRLILGNSVADSGASRKLGFRSYRTSMPDRTPAKFHRILCERPYHRSGTLYIGPATTSGIRRYV